MDSMLPFTDHIGDIKKYCEKIAREMASPHTKKEKKYKRQILAKFVDKTQKEVKNQLELSKVQCEECHEWFENEERIIWHSLIWLSSNDH